ncbi:chromosome partitioning protein ParB [Oleiphilus sp. HI0009]|uniref:ParB/RepB/Spo0J family partition protein n=1 Tax=unclassified Oleiphilus TaxID=2631174 RepID=UPI0007C40695|nr:MULTISPECIES: ParB/RepB/Spo0J family partition protein [unclassified Oleiphilus]KZX73506.1 chromosome partitioning protein ParB [Oleiphilus sp. HI0009]KZY64460.1 chromosome partitioning protein ParB [Oleiphilus sp. HI0066]KZY71617.1 chromosome partitioning protein ParB [Oleiphilus sp. HI0067]KZY75572.1 chromosome partitioning protein ParB [Oleiphilus sp. HI0067]
MAKKRVIGEKGLGALLKGSNVEALKKSTHDEKHLREIPVELIQRGKYQPRRDMDQQALEELAESIRQQGIMQPIVVRPISESKFEIIAGERRWRASQIAGLDRVPTIVRDVPDEAAVAMALIENIQRENLNAMEEAIALQRLQDEFDLTQQEVAEAIGKSRSTVTNLLRLMNLNDDVKLMLEHGDLEMGHGRALLALAEEDQLSAANQVNSRSMSVRQTEALVRKMLEAPATKKATKAEKDPNILRLETDLSEKLGASIDIAHGKGGKGKLVISYNSLNELDGILSHIK